MRIRIAPRLIVPSFVLVLEFCAFARTLVRNPLRYSASSAGRRQIAGRTRAVIREADCYWAVRFSGTRPMK